MVEAQATFVEVVRVTRESVPLEEALAITSRVMRGGYVRAGEVRGGLARERVYLAALARVRRAIERDPTWFERLGDRRLSIGASRFVP